MSDRGQRMHDLVAELYPICRSITGHGVRRTLARLRDFVELEIHEVPTGTAALDWTVPREWNIRDAWIKDAHGRKLVDFADSNLHVVSYSVPIRRRIGAEELAGHLHSLPDRPRSIPYRTSYYEESWGFCVTEEQRRQLASGDFEVCVDSSLEPGHLSYGEAVLPGQSSDEVLVSTHVCHPSLANDNLSGIAVSAFLAQQLAARERRFTYRFLFAPGTIGALTWLSRNREGLARVRHGVTLTSLGDERPLCYKRSFDGRAAVDRAFEHVMAGVGGRVIDFVPYGYDERQFNAPGFRLAVGSLTRGRHGEFPEYHCSDDCPAFVRPERLDDALQALLDAMEILERNACYRSLQPWGEPQLGRRGLYRALGGHADPGPLQMAMFWVLSMCDGSSDLLAVAERSGLPFARVREAAQLLEDHGLLTEEHDLRILMTGDAGYIGAVMRPMLQTRGHEVWGLDSDLFEGCDFGPHRPVGPSLRRDLRDVRAADLEGFDAVVHLAAISNDPLGDLNPGCTYDINHLASTHLAGAAKQARVRRFLYSSSCSVYGAAHPDDVLDESAQFRPVTPYARSKVLVEADLARLADDDFSPTFLRNATVYGISPRLRGDLVVNNLVGWAVTTGRVFLKSDGSPWRPLVHVEDVCAAFAAALEAPLEVVHGAAFNVGREHENYRIRDVASIVAEAVPGSRVEFAEGAGPDPRCYRVSFAKIARLLPGFQPRWDVPRGVEQLRDAFRAAGLRCEDLEGNRYLRIRHILRLLEEGRLDADLRWKGAA